MDYCLDLTKQGKLGTRLDLQAAADIFFVKINDISPLRGRSTRQIYLQFDEKNHVSAIYENVPLMKHPFKFSSKPQEMHLGQE